MQIKIILWNKNHEHVENRDFQRGTARILGWESFLKCFPIPVPCPCADSYMHWLYESPWGPFKTLMVIIQFWRYIYTYKHGHMYITTINVIVGIISFIIIFLLLSSTACPVFGSEGRNTVSIRVRLWKAANDERGDEFSNLAEVEMIVSALSSQLYLASFIRALASFMSAKQPHQR